MPISMEVFYENMKDALRHFGLRFHQMDLVTVFAKDGRVYFQYANTEISYDLSK